MIPQNEYTIVSVPQHLLNKGLYIPGVKAVTVKKPPAQGDDFKNRIPVAAAQDAPLYVGALGTPVYSNLDISGGSFIDVDGVKNNIQGLK